MVANRDKLIDEILTSINANGVQRNFSVLGGEPLSLQNVDDVNVIITAVRQAYPNIKIMVWTGFTWEKLMDMNEPLVNNILNQIDVLIDGQFELDKRDITLWLRGSSNQRVIDVKKSLKEEKICELTNPF
jgi:anaerobic ribonucleoside-triphosphate reductase activating protein